MWSHNDLWLGKIEGLFWSMNNRCRHWLGLVQLSIHWNISFVATSIARIVTISWRLILMSRLIVWPVSCGMVGLVWPVSCGMVGLMWPVYWSVAWVLISIYFIGSDVLIGSIIFRVRVR